MARQPRNLATPYCPRAAANERIAARALPHCIRLTAPPLVVRIGNSETLPPASPVSERPYSARSRRRRRRRVDEPGRDQVDPDRRQLEADSALPPITMTTWSARVRHASPRRPARPIAARARRRFRVPERPAWPAAPGTLGAPTRQRTS